MYVDWFLALSFPAQRGCYHTENPSSASQPGRSLTHGGLECRKKSVSIHKLSGPLSAQFGKIMCETRVIWGGGMDAVIKSHENVTLRLWGIGEQSWTAQRGVVEAFEKSVMAGND